MKNLIVAGILGTMLTFSKSAQTAQAFDRFEPYRRAAYGSGGYQYRGQHDDYANFGRCESCDQFGCGPLMRNTSNAYESSYLYRPYSTAGRYSSDRYHALQLSDRSRR